MTDRILVALIGVLMALAAALAVATLLFLLAGGVGPAPRETPYLWIDEQPEGGACYVVGNTLGPCFEKPRPDEPSP